MDKGCKMDRPVREMTLPEEIRELAKYDVPDTVIDRLLRKVEDCGKAEMERSMRNDRIIRELQDHNHNKDAIINALGRYLVIENSRCREL